jgi:flavin reductase (DIM6/NTAB) family NADH-FMN oxidoreductase RutF
MAHLVCRVQDVWPAGDHSLFVGEVLHHAQEEDCTPPLLFYGGRYRQIEQVAA